MSTVKATNFQNAGSATTNLVLDTAGNATVAGMVSPGYSFMRNKIINGDMRIDQRNAGASVTPTGGGQYVLDRWNHNLTIASKFSVQQNAGAVTPPAGFTNYLGVTSLSAYSVLTSDYFSTQQNIEGFNVADLGWGAAGAQSVTLSFWVRSSLTGTFGGSLRNDGNTRSYPFTYSISSANTWEYKTVTIAGDTTGTWTTNNTSGIKVGFGLGAGSTFSGTAGSWSSNNYFSATGATSVVGTNGATWYITGVQLEAGTVATPFERRQYGQELILCQRYYEKSDGSQGSGFMWVGNTTSSVNYYSTNRFCVKKRGSPTVALNTTAVTGFPSVTADNVDAGGFRTTGTANATGNGNLFLGQFTADAEL